MELGPWYLGRRWRSSQRVSWAQRLPAPGAETRTLRGQDSLCSVSGLVVSNAARFGKWENCSVDLEAALGNSCWCWGEEAGLWGASHGSRKQGQASSFYNLPVSPVPPGGRAYQGCWQSRTVACKFVAKETKIGKVLVAQSPPTVCNPVDCSPPGSSVHGILQARILERVAFPFSRGSSRPTDLTSVSCRQSHQGKEVWGPASLSHSFMPAPRCPLADSTTQDPQRDLWWWEACHLLFCAKSYCTALSFFTALTRTQMWIHKGGFMQMRDSRDGSHVIRKACNEIGMLTGEKSSFQANWLLEKPSTIVVDTAQGQSGPHAAPTTPWGKGCLSRSRAREPEAQRNQLVRQGEVLAELLSS